MHLNEFGHSGDTVGKGGLGKKKEKRTIVAGKKARVKTASTASVEAGLLKTVQNDEYAAKGGLATMSSLRKASGLGKDAFDSAMLSLSRAGKVVLHYHDHTGVMSKEQRDNLVRDTNGVYYVGVGLKK